MFVLYERETYFEILFINPMIRSFNYSKYGEVVTRIILAISQDLLIIQELVKAIKYMVLALLLIILNYII